MNPASTSVEQTREAITRFLSSSREPVLLEPGEEPVRLTDGNWTIEYRGGRLTLQAWDDTRNIVRRVTAVSGSRPDRVELTTERFGKRAGSLLLMDRQASRNQPVDRRASRVAFRENFRRRLRRRFPDWRITELTTEADLEHSLSPGYPRALLRKGSTAQAAIAASAGTPDAGAALTFGIIWLDYLRRRERKLTIEGLCLFLPAGRERVACMRLRWINPNAGRFSVYVCTEDGYEDPVDLADYGNLETRLARATRPSPGQPARVDAWVGQVLSSVPAAERVARNDGSTSLRVRGLEFARATGEELLFGLETHRIASAANLPEMECLAAELVRMRSPEAANPENPLYSRNPEGWLESQVRAAIQTVDASLARSPIYGQVPAFTAGDRDVIDLLAADTAGRLVALELKASEDLHLPMQALDYWMRVRWHAARDEFSPAGYFPGIRLRTDAPRLLLVAPAFAFHPSNELVLRYFSSDIDVQRIGVGSEWRRELKVMFRY